MEKVNQDNHEHKYPCLLMDKRTKIGCGLCPNCDKDIKEQGAKAEREKLLKRLEWIYSLPNDSSKDIELFILIKEIKEEKGK